ncbi:hypothetical protein X975_06628, partial [Stegodyphus mimosarum]
QNDFNLPHFSQPSDATDHWYTSVCFASSFWIIFTYLPFTINQIFLPNTFFGSFSRCNG